MNLAFLDPAKWDYDAGTPYERPMGGSESALCYLTVALAARGHAVTLFTGTTKPRVFQGVQCLNSNAIPRGAFDKCDAVIVLNQPLEICFKLRSDVQERCRLILWTGNAHDQAAMAPLQRPEVRAGWDRVVCVSQWHAAMTTQHFGLDPNRVAVMRNAIGPAFANLFPDAAALARAKSGDGVLAYTSTPFRGLNVLLSIFPEVYRRDPRLRLRVYSSMKVYNVDESNDPFASLYALCKWTPGVEYVGSLPQPALAEALKSAQILSYPNLFAETSCIAVMEAMAAGLFVVSTEQGALPETTMGMAALLPAPAEEKDLPAFARAYADRLMTIVREISRDPQQFWLARWEQVRAVQSQCTWPVRAAEWEQLLQAK